METMMHLLVFVIFFLSNGGIAEGTRNLPKSKALTAVQSQCHEEQQSYISVTRTTEGNYYGAQASIGVYHPKVFNDSSSNARILIRSSSPGVDEHIEAGLTVNPLLNGDNLTRFYVGWKGKDSCSICYNFECPGFVKTNKESPLNFFLDKISVHDGQQYEIDVQIYMDNRTGDWWVQYGNDNTTLGYWQHSLFNKLGIINSRSTVEWGGEVRFPKNTPSPQMGSGYLPYDGPKKAAVFQDIHYIDAENNMVSLEQHSDILSKYSDSTDDCYDVDGQFVYYKKDIGYTFYYGGPGYC